VQFKRLALINRIHLIYLQLLAAVIVGW